MKLYFNGIESTSAQSIQLAKELSDIQMSSAHLTEQLSIFLMHPRADGA